MNLKLKEKDIRSFTSYNSAPETAETMVWFHYFHSDWQNRFEQLDEYIETEKRQKERDKAYEQSINKYKAMNIQSIYQAEHSDEESSSSSSSGEKVAEEEFVSLYRRSDGTLKTKFHLPAPARVPNLRMFEIQ